MDKKLIDLFIKNAIAEDVGDGDHTSLSTIPKNTQGKAKLIVKENGILAGVELALEIFNQIDPDLKVNVSIADGVKVNFGDIAFTVEGNTHSILLAERLVLNCMQRMSGIATKTNRIVELLKPYQTKVLDTRKTTPNFRLLEKEAVRIGGGYNHRFGLYDMILIIDNHIKAAGSVRLALEATGQYCTAKKINLPVVVEVKNQDELLEVLAFDFVIRILLDNMTPATVATMVAINQNKKQPNQ